jgi:hypothetical protein
MLRLLPASSYTTFVVGFALCFASSTVGFILFVFAMPTLLCSCQFLDHFGFAALTRPTGRVSGTRLSVITTMLDNPITQRKPIEM